MKKCMMAALMILGFASAAQALKTQRVVIQGNKILRIESKPGANDFQYTVLAVTPATKELAELLMSEQFADKAICDSEVFVVRHKIDIATVYSLTNCQSYQWPK